jgi:outer membrane immunogenic protein
MGRKLNGMGDFMRKVFIASIACCALVAPAVAADLPPKLVKAAPAPVPVATWDGFYVGASVGWQQNKSDWTTTCLTADGTCADGFVVDASSPHTFETSGARFGAYFGVNWQVSPSWLVGVEADVGFSDKTSAVTGVVGCTTFCNAFVGGTPAFDSTSIRTSWDGSLRLRGGYLITPAFLVYGTGGLAERMIDAHVNCAAATSPWCALDDNQTFSNHMQTGWTVGGGLEWKAMNNIVLRGEYRFSDYGTFSPTFFSASVDELHAKITSRSQTALFGISYLFNGTPVK